MSFRSTIVALLTGATVLLAAAPAQGTDWYQVTHPGTPRVQWNSNYGYCGETSMISAGLELGQYTSQWTARQIASPRVPETRAASQLLLGENDLDAARRMKLTAERAPETRDYLTFMTWVRQHIADGHTVIIGVYNNTTELGETGPGDPTYDHIVPIYGYESTTPITPTSRALPSDMITISDNGLRTVGPHMPMLFSYRVGDFRLTRAEANSPGGPTYSLPKNGPWYGLAVTGVADPRGETLPVTVHPSRKGEGLQNQPRLTAAPKERDLRLRVAVDRDGYDGPVTVFEYDSFTDVPVSGFAENAESAARVWRFPAGTDARFVVDGRTGDTRVFRAVRG